MPKDELPIWFLPRHGWGDPVTARRRQQVDGFDIRAGRLSPTISVGTPLHPSLRLELGAWSRERIEDGLARATSMGPRTSERVLFWARALLGTPTFPESTLPELSRHEVRVRLETLDCVALIYMCLALARSSTFEEFVCELIRLRYSNSHARGVDNDPSSGNFLDSGCESLLLEAVRSGLLEDITATLANEPSESLKVSTLSTAHVRDPKFDETGRVARSAFGELAISRTLLNQRGLEIAMESLQPGDIVLLTRGASMPTLVAHCFIVELAQGSYSYIHAGFDDNWLSEEACLEPQHDPKRPPQLNCGVSRGAIHAGEQFTFPDAVRLHNAHLRPPTHLFPGALSGPHVGALILRPQ